MREIKFRAWDKTKKMWVSELNQESSAVLNYDSHSLVKWNNYELSQFTGLKDKNGKEIYEGDRAKIIQSNGSTVMATVAFIDGCFDLLFDEPVRIYPNVVMRDYVKCWTINHALEIIGNIYEGAK